MTTYKGIKCHGNIQLTEAVINRLKDLGYATVSSDYTPFLLAEMAAHGVFIEKGTRRITMPSFVKLNEDEDRESDDVTWLNLHKLFSNEDYRWMPPEKHLNFSIDGHNTYIKEGKLIVGCKKISFDTVEDIYNAIQEYKKDMTNES